MTAGALGLWGVLVLMFAAPLALTGDVSWRQGVRFGLSFWALWPLLAPAVVWLAFRFPVERNALVRNVGVHLLACVLMVGTIRATFVAFRAAGDSFRQLRRLVSPEPPGFRTALDVLVYWSLVGVCEAIRNFRRSQERERRAAELEASLNRAKLQALRMQINPHFLFNTLNSISALVYVNPRAADEMLGDLSVLLRRSLDTMEEQEIPLAQELEFVGSYLAIEQKRFGDRLQLEQDVAHEVMTAMVPALILQPLVENAIRHGIEPRRGAGVIRIEARREEERLHLVVRDNGNGLPADWKKAGREGVGGNAGIEGIGLANTRARLEGLYGANQRFSVGNEEPQGCRVEIQIPLHFEAVQVPAEVRVANGGAA